MRIAQALYETYPWMEQFGSPRIEEEGISEDGKSYRFRLVLPRLRVHTSGLIPLITWPGHDPAADRL